MERVYYRYIFRLKSPLALGSGISDNTDSDVLLDSRGVPYIPATSIAGVIRHSVDEDTARELFGTIQNGSGEMSKVLTSLHRRKRRICTRQRKAEQQGGGGHRKVRF